MMKIDVENESEDGLRREVWRVRLMPARGGPERLALVLTRYAIEERLTRRHKYRVTLCWHFGAGWSGDPSPNAPPVPADVLERVHRAVQSMIEELPIVTTRTEGPPQPTIDLLR
jgi:hypothetical protein